MKVLLANWVADEDFECFKDDGHGHFDSMEDMAVPCGIVLSGWDKLDKAKERVADAIKEMALLLDEPPLGVSYWEQVSVGEKSRTYRLIVKEDTGGTLVRDRIAAVMVVREEDVL